MNRAEQVYFVAQNIRTHNKGLAMSKTLATGSCKGNEGLRVKQQPKFLILISSSLSSYHEKAAEALCLGRIQTRLGVAFVSEFYG